MKPADQILAHHGVKGMKWGVRKETDTGTGRRHRLPKSEDALKSHAARSKAKTHGRDSLSNEELRALVNRMNLEQQFSTLNKGTIKKGEAHVKSALAVATTIAAVHQFATSPTGKIIRSGITKKLIKKAVL
jgi:hypothetical protein